MAGSWRNRSSSLVGLERLAGMGTPTVAKGRGTLAGQRLEEVQSPGALPQGPWGHQEERELELLLRGERHLWSVVLPHSKALQPYLPWTVLARHILGGLLVSQQYDRNALKWCLPLLVYFIFQRGTRTLRMTFLPVVLKG